ncbi:MAG: hypothetical protein P1U72_09955 [Paracoccaceae bacterium]|nr:hypothetical protein [Paracoccaceae bacterium]
MATSMMSRSLELAERLLGRLPRAKLVAPEKLRQDLVTIGSTVTYRGLTSDRVQTVVLSYLEGEEIDQRRIPVLKPAVIALLGLGA